MFSPMNIGTFDNLLAMQAAEDERADEINDMLTDLIPCKDLEQRKMIVETSGLEPFSETEIMYINDCLRANKII